MRTSNLEVALEKRAIYRVTLVVSDSDMGWVDLNVHVPLSCLATKPLLPNSHQSRHIWADCGTFKIQDKLTYVAPRPPAQCYPVLIFNHYVRLIYVKMCTRIVTHVSDFVLQGCVITHAQPVAARTRNHATL